MQKAFFKNRIILWASQNLQRLKMKFWMNFENWSLRLINIKIGCTPCAIPDGLVGIRSFHFTAFARKFAAFNNKIINLAKASSSTCRFIGIHLFGPRFRRFFFFSFSGFEAEDLALERPPRWSGFKSPTSKFPSSALARTVAFVFSDAAVSLPGIRQYCSCSLPEQEISRVRATEDQLYYSKKNWSL